MQISVVSGKGGAGKTTVATHLFMTNAGTGLIDCDVEEPNASLFLNLDMESEETFNAVKPVIDENKCTHCGSCGTFCQFRAILTSKAATIVLPERCHDCGGCARVCPEGAISYEDRPAGRIVRGRSAGDPFSYGELDIGEYSGVKMIRKLRQEADGAILTWIDGPPGTGCAAVAAVEGADYAVLVGEPTPFGVSDMAMAAQMLRDLQVPFGVVVNKSGIGNNEIYEYCRDEEITLLGEVPFDRSLAEAYATGLSAWGHSGIPEIYRHLTRRIWSENSRGSF